jgi:hypothetical protein
MISGSRLAGLKQYLDAKSVIFSINATSFSTADCRLPTADCRLPTADCRLPTADYPLDTSTIKQVPETGLAA